MRGGYSFDGDEVSVPENLEDHLSRYHHEITAAELAAGESAHALAILSVPPGSHVLDVGASDGSVAKALVQRGCRVWGVEMDEASATQAKEVCEDVVIGDVELLDLDSAYAGMSFDVVLLLDVLEHLKEPAQLLRRVARLLAPHGCIVASIPNVAHGAVRLQLLKGRFAYTKVGLLDQTHLRFFDRSSLEAMFRDAGMSIRDDLRARASLTDTEIDIDLDEFPDEIIDMLNADPDVDTYQFVVVAVPAASEAGGAMSGSLLGNLQRRLHQLERAQHDSTEHRRALEARLEEREARLEERERALAHSEQALAHSEQALTHSEQALAQLEQALAQSEQAVAVLQSHLQAIEGRAGYIALNRVTGALARVPMVQRIARRVVRRATGPS